MLFPNLEEKLIQARAALKSGTHENLIDLCKRYLALLTEYRSELYDLKDADLLSSSLTSPNQTAGMRRAVREAIETTTDERNRTERLLLSFCTLSGYESVEIFNQLKYKGHDDWELKACGVKFSEGTDDDLMSVQEAVKVASRIRRDQYIAQNTTGQNSGNVHASVERLSCSVGSEVLKKFLSALNVGVINHQTDPSR